MNQAYINGIGNISPQMTFASEPFLEVVIRNDVGKWLCIEPDYSGWIDPKSMRRMSRIIRMGVASASLALKEAGIKVPDAVITGTGYGCLEDTGAFLSKMITSREQSLNPTPFMQSTHNSIGSQIALLMQCFGYNQTYVQGGFSLENSLLDALMNLEENPDHQVLVGGIDEITEISHKILSRFGLFRRGARQGEGAAYFLLSANRQETSYASINAVGMFHDLQSSTEIRRKFINFLDNNLLNSRDVDMVLFGSSGDDRLDRLGSEVTQDLWGRTLTGTYKHLCGEFPTSSGFALWLAANILKQQHVPSVVASSSGAPIRNILIYNPYFGKNHSLILLQSC